tara:strand:- start:475 stop:606 length:132 start_codon:yes stop_codon:yes gene_type:complete
MDEAKVEMNNFTGKGTEYLKDYMDAKAAYEKIRDDRALLSHHK